MLSFFKKLLAGILLTQSLMLTADDHNEFNHPELPGCLNECNPRTIKFSHFTETDGNRCLKMEIVDFTTVKDSKERLINGSVWLGNFKTAPNQVYDYEIFLKGTADHVYLSCLEWDGPRRYSDLKIIKPFSYRKIPLSGEWKSYKGHFQAGPRAEKVAIAVNLYEDERYHKKVYQKGDYVLIDKVKIADKDGRNLFTHLSFLPAETEKTAGKKENEYVILCKGNSITRHGFNETTKRVLGWDHIAGMAASKEENDYAHRLASMIAKALPEKKIRLVFGSGNKAVLKNLEQEQAMKPDLIVWQGGEHAVVPKELPLFETFMRDTLKNLINFPGKPIVITVGVWETSPYRKGSLAEKVQTIQRKVSTEFDIPFVSVEKFANDPACRGWGTSAGVKWHPNDLGMKKYADAIFSAWQAEYQKKKESK